MRIEIDIPDASVAPQGGLLDLIRTILSHELFRGEPWEAGQKAASETFISIPSNYLEAALHASLVAAIKAALDKVPAEHRAAAELEVNRAYAVANRRRDEAIADMPEPKKPGLLVRLKDSLRKDR